MSEINFDAENHRYTDAHGNIVLSVTQILKLAGIIDDTWYNEEARMRGQAVHMATQYIDEGDIDLKSIHPKIAPFCDAYAKFKADTGFECSAIEKRVYSPIYRFAGTLDRCGIMHNHPCIIDFKTGTIPKWAGLQTAAYERALEIGPIPLSRYALELHDNGSYTLKQFSDRNDIKIFLAANSVVQWKLNQGLLKI